MRQAFRDLKPEQNFRDGVEYSATGIVIHDNGTTGTDKDLAVIYIDPWGEYQHEWRSRDEVKLLPLHLVDWEKLHSAIEAKERTT